MATISNFNGVEEQFNSFGLREWEELTSEGVEEQAPRAEWAGEKDKAVEDEDAGRGQGVEEEEHAEADEEEAEEEADEQHMEEEADIGGNK